CLPPQAKNRTTTPTTIETIMNNGIVTRRTSPSRPRIPVVVVPSNTLPGAIMLPAAPPAVWAPRIAGIESPAAVAVDDWNCPNSRLDARLEVVMNDPSPPISGASRPYQLPVALATP